MIFEAVLNFHLCTICIAIGGLKLNHIADTKPQLEEMTGTVQDQRRCRGFVRHAMYCIPLVNPYYPPPEGKSTGFHPIHWWHHPSRDHTESMPASTCILFNGCYRRASNESIRLPMVTYLGRPFLMIVSSECTNYRSLLLRFENHSNI